MSDDPANNVVSLPPTTTFTVEQALESAKSLGMSDALVIGYQDGELVVRSSRMDRKDALWLVECARLHVTQGMIWKAVKDEDDK